MSELIKIKKIAETESINVLVENSLRKTSYIAPLGDQTKILNTSNIDISVNDSLPKTKIISTINKTDTIVNTETIEMPIYKSLSTYGEKDIFLNGGETKSLAITVGKDNIVYGNVKYNPLNNALSIKDDGLFVKPIAYSSETDNNINLLIDNDSQIITSSIKNSPKLNNKFECELSVLESLNYKNGGSIDLTLNNKVDKVVGKNLSSCDYTQEEKNKLNLIDTSNYIKLFDYDNLNNKFIIQSENENKQIPLVGLIKGVSYIGAENKLIFNVTNGQDVAIDLYKDIFVMDGNYDTISKNIVLTLSNGSVINIPATDIIPTFNGAENNNIKTKVTVDNIISAEIKISNDDNNALISKNDGLFVQIVDKASLAINNVNNTADIDKILSKQQKEYVDNQVSAINTNLTNFVKKSTEGNLDIKSSNGNIVFYVNNSPKMEISSQGVNFLL